MPSLSDIRKILGRANKLTNELSDHLVKAACYLKMIEQQLSQMHSSVPTPEDIQRVDKHYGVSWQDVAEQANVSCLYPAKSYAPGVPQSHIAQCPNCGRTFEVTNPERLAEVDGLCQKCWKSTQAT